MVLESGVEDALGVIAEEMGGVVALEDIFEREWRNLKRLDDT